MSRPYILSDDIKYSKASFDDGANSGDLAETGSANGAETRTFGADDPGPHNLRIENNDWLLRDVVT